MPFGPLVTLILLIYTLFLGIIMTFWFLLSPRRKPDTEQPRQQEESYESMEEQRYRSPTKAYAGSNDTMRGANASRVVRTKETIESAQTRERGRSNVTERENVKSYESDTRVEDARTRRKRREVEPKDREVRDSDRTRPTQKRKNDAFEDFIRSKNDDFDF